MKSYFSAFADEDFARKFGKIGQDYDYSKIGKLDYRGHGTDKGKLPWHPTFSNESEYSGSNFTGGVWDRNGNYTPSMDMIKSGQTAGLQKYFNKYEKESKLLTTPPMSKSAFINATK